MSVGTTPSPGAIINGLDKPGVSVESTLGTSFAVFVVLTTTSISGFFETIHVTSEEDNV